MSSNMLRRVSVAATAIPLALLVVYVGGWALSGVIALLGVVGASELYGFARQRGVEPIRDVGLLAAAAIPLVAFTATPTGFSVTPRWIALGTAGWVMILLTVAMARYTPQGKPLATVSITIFGAAYAGGMPSFLLMLRHPSAPVSAWAGTSLVFLPLVVVWICDSAAMSGGGAIGGRKLAPVLSPNKTWSGAISGAVGGVAAALLFGLFILVRTGLTLSVWQLVVFGLVVSSVGQIGDLAESLLKREAGVKDSGTFFPGHGGVLDRLDSLYWALPTAALLLSLFGTI